MVTTTIKVQCGKCHVALQVPDRPKPNDSATCPKCGASERYDRVMKRAEKMLEKVVADTLDKSFTRALRGNKNVRYDRKR